MDIIKVIVLVSIYLSLALMANNEIKADIDEPILLEAVNSPIYIKPIVYAAKEQEKIYAYVSGYNTVYWQTDSTPCISASGDNICGRSDVVACPRYIPLGTWVKIDGKNYQCLDRMAEKYTNDNYFDICFDKDIQSALDWGVRYKEILILE